ncbi:MAG: metallophosphoesterase [Deltaproteobacteria bacterium]|nr:metallophosphoesterase [Deltaproteobacteria bacterium]
MNTKRYIVVTATSFFLLVQAGCSCDADADEADAGKNSDAQQREDTGQSDDAGPTEEQRFRFALFSDPHFYDTDLGTGGQAFEAYIALDRKLLVESPAILDATIEALQKNRKDFDFVIVPGDLTKDGERSSHEKFIARIRVLEERGLQVYVCPGNHDINNPDARSFEGETTIPVDSVTPEEFAELYADFGYRQAIERAPDSLGYLAEPVEGLWVLAIDSCKYRDNLASGISEISGALSESTLSWIERVVAEAKQKKKSFFGFMHHNLVEHFTEQSKLPLLGDEYVVDDWMQVSRRVAEAGLRLVFSGHYHAQDITKQSWQESDLFLFDVETGSLITYPDPFRKVSIEKNGRVEITSEFVDSIDFDTDDLDFLEYSKRFLHSGIDNLAVDYLNLLGVSERDALAMRPIAVETLLAHYAGDEDPSEQSRLQVEGYMASSDLGVSVLAGYLKSLQTDLPPADNDAIFNIETGEIE